MKQLVSDLMDAIADHNFDGDTDELIVRTTDALDAGALDCLVEHPASDPPNDIRDVLVLTIHGQYAIDHYQALDKEFRRCGNLAKTWRELPKGTK